MSTPKKNHRNKLPQWQLEKMRTLIEERWSEVWEVVVARERSAQSLHEYSRSLQRNSGQ